MKTIILASGENDKLFPFNGSMPKPMIPCGNKPLMAHYLAWLKEVAVGDVSVVVSENESSLQSTFAEGDAYGCKIEYLRQPEEKKGIGEALSLAKNFVGKGNSFLLVYGDTVFEGNIFRTALESFYSSREATAVIAHSRTSLEYGNVYIDGKMGITKLVEKPESGRWGNFVLAGVFVLPFHFFDVLEECGCDMEKALQSFIAKHRLHAALWDGAWIDIIHPWDMLSANALVMNQWQGSYVHSGAKIAQNVCIDGAVYIDEGAEVSSGTIVHGPAYIGKNCYIGNNCLVRKQSCLSEGVQVGYGVELKNCLVFPQSRIGRLSFVGDSVIGSSVDIGSGVMTVNRLDKVSPVFVDVGHVKVDTGLKKLGSFIGHYSSVGAGNTIAPGTVIPPKESIPLATTYPKA